jgi:hypothetical protein
MILLKIEFPLVLLQVKAVGGLNASQTFHNHTVKFPLVLLQVKAVGPGRSPVGATIRVSISSPSGEGGGQRIL